MRSKGKPILLSLMVLAAVCISVLLPYRAQLYKDGQILGLPHLQENPLPQQAELPTLSIIDRLRLLSGEKITTVSAGKHHSEEEIKAQCEAEWLILYDKDILPQVFAEMSWTETAAVAEMYLDAANVSQGMILWTLTFSSDTANLQCGIDDETGKILYMYMADDMDETADWSDRLIEAFATYLGVETSTESKKISTAAFSPAALQPGDFIRTDFQYTFTWEGEQIAYHIAKTEHGVFFGHNLLTPTSLPVNK